MLLYIPKEEHKDLLFMDTEFDNQELVQVAFVHYKRVIINDIPVYRLEGSVNSYVDRKVSTFFTEHTGITKENLKSFGIKPEEAAAQVNKFLWALNNKETLLIAHGINQDAIILERAGIHVNYMDRYCTHNAAKRILERDKNLKLIDICNEAGYYTDQHDAYTDAKNVLYVFSYLKFVEATKK
jgi:hypothetical protein